jgi:tetratricopeptide (TPR) repeat protein
LFYVLPSCILQRNSHNRLPPELLLHMALGEVHLGRSSNAFQIMIQISPAIAPKLYVSVVAALRNNSRCDLALQLICSIDGSLKAPFILLEKAKCFIDSNLHSRAIPVLQQLRSQFPEDDDSLEASLFLVECYRAINQNDEADAVNKTLPVAQVSLPKGLQHRFRRADVLRKTNIAAFADQLVSIFQSLKGTEVQSSVDPADAWILMVQTVQALLWSARASDAVKVMIIARSSVNSFEFKMKDGSFHLLLLRCAIEARDGTTCDSCLRYFISDLVRPDNLRCLTCIPDLARSCVPILSSHQRSHFYRALLRKFFSSDSGYVLSASFLCMLDCFKDKSSSMRQHVPIISIGLHAAALIDDPDDPLPPLLLVSSYLGVTLSRRAKHRHISFLNALVFLQRYADRRGEGFLAEICYNYGRFFHGLSLFSLAIPCYERAIELSLQLVHDQLMYSVIAEAAFNLSLIYRQSGQFDLERHYLLKYLVV